MVDRQCRHGGNGQLFLVENKDMSINVCVNSAYSSSDNLYVRKCHLKVSVSFFYMNLWTCLNVKKFLLCFAWNPHLQKTVNDAMNVSVFIVRKGVSAPPPLSFLFSSPSFFQKHALPLLTPIKGKYHILSCYTGIRETENN